MVAISFGVAAIGVLYLSLLAMAKDWRRYEVVTLCAGGLLLSWIVSNAVWIGLGPPGLSAYPVLDLVGGTIAALLFKRKPAPWLAVLTLCLLTQSFLHAEYAVGLWGAQSGGPQPDLYAYALKLNILFGIQLAAVAAPGAGHVARRVLDWLSRRPARRGVVVPEQGREGR